MACGCGKRRAAPALRPAGSPSIAVYEVWRDGAFTGRRFTSAVAAATYAASIGGEVRSPE